MDRQIYLIIGDDRIYLGRAHEIIDPTDRDFFPPEHALRQALRDAVTDLVFFGGNETEVATLKIELK